jgi:putative nucleotidyltransferase with HDIG domain
VIAFLTKFSLGGIPSGMEEGSIASRDIKADRNYEIVDKEATSKLKQEAVSKVVPVYDFQEDASNLQIQKLNTAFESVREYLKNIIGRDMGRKQRISIMMEQGNSDEIKRIFSESLGITLSQAELEALAAEEFSQDSQNIIANALKKILSSPVAQEKIVNPEGMQRGIILRYLKLEEDAIKVTDEKQIEDASFIPSVAAARQEISRNIITRENLKSPKSLDALLSLAKDAVIPNVSLNEEETTLRRLAAENNVQNVTIKVKSGEMIIRNGARFDARHIKILEGIREEKIRATYPLEFFGAILFVLLSVLIVLYFAERFVLRFHPARRDYILMGSIAVFHMAIMRLGFSLAPVFHSALPFDVPVEALVFAIPMAGSVMLLRMLVHAEDTFIFLVCAALMTSIFQDVDLPFISFFIISSVAGIIAISNVDRRSNIMKAGLINGIVNAAAIFCIMLLKLAVAATSPSAADIFWSMLCSFAGGLGNAMLILIAAPLVESILGYTTDIKLLELANLNHPLLRELIVRAPGTYHHSHLTGIIGEAAAEAIGANPLIVRVAAYYHDIGKIKKPLYFVENVKNGDDRHAKLSPHMSSLIISSHVKDGVEMAKEAKLPKSIIDMMVQHHGTRQISFFYEKAKAQKDADMGKMDASDFEYGGPKPQSREAAILMLADVSEAAVRSLKEKSPARIEQTVDRVIDDCFKEKQLDECDLTLRDLNEISKAFVHILLGIYHQRIEYQKESSPRQEPGVLDKEKAVANKNTKSSSEAKNVPLKGQKVPYED